MYLDSPISAGFEVDEERRTIRGLAVPYGPTASKAGKRYAFSQGSLTYGDVSRVKVLIGHDFNRAVGVATALEETENGLYLTARIAKGAAGDEALSMAAEGVWDGLSVGLGEGGKWQLRDGVHHASQAPLREVSITPMPSFDDARVTAVAAQADQEGSTMTDTVTEAPAQDFSALTEVISGAIAQGFADLRNPQERETVSAGRPLIQVEEKSPYRFDGIAAEHSFTDDVRASNMGDSSAQERVSTFMAEAFAVTTGNAATLNPTQNRPDLFVPNLTFTRPLWELVTTGTITDRTPFTVPRFSSATGLVSAHTEGVEPTPGGFTATAMTVSPMPMSGKVEINREVLDQGGSPQLDAIVWGEMQNAYFEAIEARIATTLNAVTTAEVNFAGATNSALVDAVQDVLVGLQFARGGNRFTALALDGTLYPALTKAADSTGRKLLPIFGPTNAQGTQTGGFDSISIGNLTGRAAWALGSGNAARSFLFVPGSVWAWASAPQRLTFEYQVKSVDLGIWGYSASAVLRESDVRPLDYTTADA